MGSVDYANWTGNGTLTENEAGAGVETGAGAGTDSRTGGLQRRGATKPPREIVRIEQSNMVMTSVFCRKCGATKFKAVDPETGGLIHDPLSFRGLCEECSSKRGGNVGKHKLNEEGVPVEYCTRCGAEFPVSKRALSARGLCRECAGGKGKRQSEGSPATPTPTATAAELLNLQRAAQAAYAAQAELSTKINQVAQGVESLAERLTEQLTRIEQAVEELKARLDSAGAPVGSPAPTPAQAPQVGIEQAVEVVIAHARKDPEFKRELVSRLWRSQG